MKAETVCVCIISALIFACLCNQTVSGEVINQKPAWKTLLSYNNWMDQDPAVMKIQDGYFVTGISHHKTDSGNYEYKVVLWKIDLQGKELWVKDINLPAWQTGKPFVAERCFSLKDEPTLLLVGASTLKAWLLKFDNAGSVVSSKEFSLRQVFDIQGMAKTADGLLLYGSDHKIFYGKEPNSDACVTRLGLDGNEIWRREYDKGKMEWGMGLTPLKDGGFIFSADSGKFNKFGGGPSNAWIIKCDPNGNILQETTFEGRHPNVAISDDVIAVIFNKENFPQQNMAVVGLDNELKILWRIDSLFGKTGGLGMLSMIVNKRGNFIIAGGKFKASGLWEISKEGKILRDIEIEGAEHCVQFNSLLQTKAGYLVAGAVSKMSEMPLAADGKRDDGVQWDIGDIMVAEVAEIKSE